MRGRLVHPDRYANSAAQWLFSDIREEGDLAGPGAERAGLINLAVVERLAPAPGRPRGRHGLTRLDTARHHRRPGRTSTG